MLQLAGRMGVLGTETAFEVLARHLYGQRAARRHRGEEPRHESAVIRDPLQRRVGKHQIEALFRRPRDDVSRGKVDPRMLRTRLREHLGRTQPRGLSVSPLDLPR